MNCLEHICTMSVTENLNKITASIPNDVCVVAVSKRHPAELIKEAHEAGYRDFGENMVQEMQEKHAVLPEDIRWHMIGHLQRNKVKYIVGYVYLIHGVDSLKLLLEINKRAAKINRVVSCLLQVHIAKEDTKFGFAEDELINLLNNEVTSQLTHTRIAGLMGMATNTDNLDQVSQEFNGLNGLFTRVKSEISNPVVDMKHLSMGMSGDYELAIKSGSNMIRVGSNIFGTRPQKL